ncbi:glycosyltransferase family 76 protein [Glonium stellatum]|uniref:GPI mannosyltransferase 2 n=1 Tax=Glonium stellatum TaxID=574774 RepID=A0A8E2EQF8_9PEZI|nr:glycosyltransferase family 76 protein [Glonium stellatum]
MSAWKPFSQPSNDPIKSLVIIFVLWKFVLVLLAIASPVPGYDTSTLILIRGHDLNLSRRTFYSEFHTIRERLSLSLVRWDAIYFVKTAERGYVNEQEWAFSWVFTRLIAFFAFYLPSSKNALESYIWAGLLISLVSHLLSVLVLHRLFITVRKDTPNSKVAFVAAVLHIISPAGLFLSAPYGESLFSLFNFSGMLLYAKYQRAQQDRSSRHALKECYLVGSGCCFAMATSLRSNGLLSGLIFAYDVATLLPSLLGFRLDLIGFRRLLATVIAGLLTAIGFLGPQWLAYEEFCGVAMSNGHVRPWCTKLFPSIYSWVQVHYWDLGFLRYWTLSNVPLFLIAAPMLWLLVQSSFTALTDQLQAQILSTPSPSTSSPSRNSGVRQTTLRPGKETESDDIERGCLRRLALPQLVLALTTFTSFHVQIINRISSGYPLWYLAIAISLVKGTPLYVFGKAQSSASSWVVHWMISYAIIQGGLFASFLPPA